MGLSTRAKTLLEGWQRNAWAKLGVHSPPDWGEATKEVLDAVLASAGVERTAGEHAIREQLSDLDLPTPYEDPGWFVLMRINDRQVRRVVVDLHPQIGDTEVFYGSIPSGLANALTVRIRETGEYLHLFSAGFFLFINLMAKVAARCVMAAVRNTPRGHALDHRAIPWILNDPELHLRFREALYAHVVVGNAAGARPYAIAPDAVGVASALRDGAELFVVAHEYGHVVEGHLEADTTMLESSVAGEASVFGPEWGQELDADARALEVLARVVATTGRNPVLGLASVHFFFVTLDLVGRLIDLFMGPHDKISAVLFGLVESVPGLYEGGRDGDGHPAPGGRRLHARARIRDLSREGDDANEMGEDIRAMMEHLWKASLPGWMALREQGVELCPLWDPRVSIPNDGAGM